jgi:AraC-like DNA-binding protein
MLLEFENKRQLQNSMLLAYLKVLLIYISRLYTEQYTNANPAADRELLKKFKALIAENFVDAHEVADYAAMLNLSAGHFSEQIKEQSGKTAIEHIHDRLLLEAKRLLFHTEYPVKEIAYRLGFEEASYFNRFFKRLANTTPLGYRSTIRKMYH